MLKSLFGDLDKPPSPESLRKLELMGNMLALAFTVAAAGVGLFIGGISKAQGTVLSFSDNIGALVARFKASWEMVGKIGSDFVDGLWKGIKGKWDELVEGVTKLAEKLPDAVKKALKIQSPSKVMMQLGEQTAEGFEVGVRSKDVDRSLEDIVSPPSLGSGGFGGGGGTRIDLGGIRVEVHGVGGDAQMVGDVIAERISLEVERKLLLRLEEMALTG
jgi:hypothetical protein